MRASGIRAAALGPSQAPGASSARPPAPRTRVRRKAPLEGLLVPTRPASSDGTEDHLCPPPPLLNSPPGKIKPRMILLSPPPHPPTVRVSSPQGSCSWPRGPCRRFSGFVAPSGATGKPACGQRGVWGTRRRPLPAGSSGPQPQPGSPGLWCGARGVNN